MGVQLAGIPASLPGPEQGLPVPRARSLCALNWNLILNNIFKDLAAQVWHVVSTCAGFFTIPSIFRPEGIRGPFKLLVSCGCALG